jgi:hypothetical protein
MVFPAFRKFGIGIEVLMVFMWSAFVAHYLPIAFLRLGLGIEVYCLVASIYLLLGCFLP